MSLEEKIKQALQQGRKMTFDELVEEVGEHEKVVRAQLKEMKYKTLKKEKGLWSLK